MKVHELVSLLQTMPQEAKVVYRYHSEFTAMDAEEIKFWPATEKRIMLHNGVYMEYNTNFDPNYRPASWDRREYSPQPTTPNFVDVVAFPGN